MSNQPKKPLKVAEEAAKQITFRLGPACDRIEVAGSIRRRKPEVGDIEIVVIPGRDKDLLGEPIPDLPTHLDMFFSERDINLVKNGPRYKQFQYGAWQVDLFTPDPAWWGLRLVLSTGSREFNIWMVEVLRSRGFRMSGGRISGALHREIEIPEEQDLFNLVELPFIPPEKRQNGHWREFIE